MCNFKSAVVLPDLTVLIHDWTDSHSDIIEMHGLRDDKPEPSFVKVEYSSSNNEHWNIDTYVLNVDQDRVPEWWNDEAMARVERTMQRRVKKMIITENRKLLVGGQYIIHDCKVSDIKNANIISISGSASIGKVYGYAIIGDVSGSARIDYVYGSARIDYVYDSVRIGKVYRSATIINDHR